MNTPPAPLSLAERNRRWNLARDLMRAEGLQALVVYGDREAAAPAGFSPDCYFSNDRPGSLVVFIGDEAPRVYTFASLMIADHIQSALRGDLQWIAPEQLYVGKTGRDVGAWLAERGLDGSRVGIIGLEPYPPFYFDGALPARTLQGLAQALPKAELVPVYKAFFRLASVKSEEELGLVRYAAHIGEAMSETLRATARPGSAKPTWWPPSPPPASPWAATPPKCCWEPARSMSAGDRPRGSTGRSGPGCCARATSCCRRSSRSMA